MCSGPPRCNDLINRQAGRPLSLPFHGAAWLFCFLRSGRILKRALTRMRTERSACMGSDAAPEAMAGRIIYGNRHMTVGGLAAEYGFTAFGGEAARSTTRRHADDR